MVAPDVHWVTLLPPQTHCALSVARADCAGCVPVAVLTPALLEMSSDLLGAEGDHQPKSADPCSGDPGHAGAPSGAMPSDPGLSCAPWQRPL